MPLTGQQLVEMSLEQWKRNSDDAQQEFYQRMADHAEGGDALAADKYFPQAFAESDARYAKRAKEALPIGASALEVLTSHMMGDGVQVTIGEDESPSNSIYTEIAEENDLDGEHAVWLASQAGTFGWTMDVIRPSETPISRPDQIEFEAVDPRGFRASYNTARIGGTKRTVGGVSFCTLYDYDEGSILPADTPIGATGSKAQRVEIITPDVWAVYLDGTMTPLDPVTGAMWQPADDGSNPFGVVVAVPLWNIPQVGAMEGKADLDPSYTVAEQINRNYSRLLDNIDHYFPTLTYQSDTESSLAKGIGLALQYDTDSQAPGYITPMFDVNVLLEPYRMQLNLFFSLAHTPASSHGLGAVFGEAKAAESGRAKFYEFSRLERHIAKKRTSYERFIRTRWRTLADFINNGTSMSVDRDASVQIEWASSIVPVSEEERVDTIIKEMEAGLLSRLDAVMRHRRIDDPEEAQKIVDEIGVQAGRAAPRDRFEMAMEEELRGA